MDSNFFKNIKVGSCLDFSLFRNCRVRMSAFLILPSPLILPLKHHMPASAASIQDLDNDSVRNHCCHKASTSGATFPSAIHSVACWSHLGTFSCFHTIAINSSSGPSKMQRLNKPKEKSGQKTEKFKRLCMPQ